jgi:transcriptional regulator with XRE-family HTH domain
MSSRIASHDGGDADPDARDLGLLMSAALHNRAGNGIVVKNGNQIDISLGCRLREKRTAAGWSQQQLAEKLQIDPRDIQAYETGSKRITADQLLRPSKVLGVKPVYFFGFDDARPVNRDKALLTLPDQGTASAPGVHQRQKPGPARGHRHAGD